MIKRIKYIYSLSQPYQYFEHSDRFLIKGFSVNDALGTLPLDSGYTYVMEYVYSFQSFVTELSFRKKQAPKNSFLDKGAPIGEVLIPFRKLCQSIQSK